MFCKEIDMQKTFIEQLKIQSPVNEIILEEFSARFGNVDVIKVNINKKAKATIDQTILLSEYQCSKVTGYLHKKQSHSLKYLMEKTGYTYDNLKSIICKLKKHNIIVELNTNKYIISENFEFPNLEFIAYELKLKNWKNAITQAIKNKSFASYSYIVLPEELAKFVYKKEKTIFKLYNIGLIGINNENHKTYFKPLIEKNRQEKNPTYIASLAKLLSKENEQLY